MPSTEQLRSRLLKKLSELFQLDQPDLDFGFYRIMHAKAQEVQDFIDNGLLKIVADAFGEQAQASSHEQKEAARQKVIATLGESAVDASGVLNPAFEQTPAGIAYIEEIKNITAQKDNLSAEADVYDHLYRFFERYYDDGDFISRRYYTRETPGKAAPFAVPYNGEEVKLHWANADQYYIKSAEYFSNFTFDLTQSAEVRKMSQEERELNQIPSTPLKVQFRVVDASEGEHGNVKAAEDKKRFFILHEENPVEFNDADELVINFEYKTLPSEKNEVGVDTEKALKGKYGKSLNKGDMPNLAIAEKIIEVACGLDKTQEYPNVLELNAPTDKIPNRPLLAKYINQYTARNTMDYFIHKDLGGFLRRELDFYIKNEVMRLDDIENADAPAVESYLAKIKVLRKIAGKLVDFLAQLEEFQKKLWLKKKFVVETNYCITLDRVPEELYPEIAANEAQCEEWIKLFAIDEIQADLHSPGFSRPLTIEFLKANNKLVLDTQFFDDSFKAMLLASIENFDEQCDGLLIHSENFQALNLLQERYREQAQCFYVDPPYNTGSDGFSYKDSYQHSSWYSMILNSIINGKALLSSSGIFSATIDDNEVSGLLALLKDIFGSKCLAACAPWRSEPSGGKEKTGLRSGHEYLAIFHNGDPQAISSDERSTGELNLSDKWGKYRKGRELRKWGGTSLREDRLGQFYELKTPTGETSLPIRNDGREGHWRWGKENPGIKAALEDPEFFHWELTPYDPGVEVDGQLERWTPYEKIRDVKKSVGWATWLDTFGINADATRRLKDLFNYKPFETPKPVALLEWFLNLHSSSEAICIDTFAGSGALGDAVISLNRSDSGSRKYLLVEIAAYFDFVLLPRLKKVVYSGDWAFGKPTTRHTGVSHCFKYIRLESYEDTLNNLRLDHNTQRKKAVAANPALKEDYMLRYLLDVETRGSQSLLNIDAFADPTAYTLEVKKPGTDEYVTRAVDLIETFNYLIGLRVEHYGMPQTFTATFKRIKDPELPEDQHTKLVVDGRIRQEEDGPWWFRKVEGWVPKDPANPNNGLQEKVLVVWRKLTDDIEQDNLMLDEWFQKNRISTRDFEFDTIYVNGSNNLPNLKHDEENWKVRLIEEEFLKRMWDMGGV
jgi:adenine-specific DNA-methyltransferase|tara:strand:- start:4626 stop:7994 length:3369 start_codon:yes stop_codon:yes gene_type:complete